MKIIIRKKGYCAHCWSACPTVAEIENGKFKRVLPDKDHPNAVEALCPKGLAGPEMVYSNYRMKYPMKRTNPKTASDPGWKRITWDEAYDTIASKFKEIMENYGPEKIAFHRSSPSGTPASEFNNWTYRLAYALGTPNTLATTHICQWARDAGSAYTYGTGIMDAEFDKSAVILIWGQNTKNTALSIDREIEKGLKNGAKLIVVDPRHTELARKANHWLQIFPGTDLALALSFINVLLAEEIYDKEFTQYWTNAPFLFRTDTMDLARADEIYNDVRSYDRLVIDENSGQVIIYDPEAGRYQEGVRPSLNGDIDLLFKDGRKVKCKTIFSLLKETVSKYTPEWAENITMIPAAKIKKAARLFATNKPAGYFSYNGIEQQVSAMQMNRALCIFYSLTGNYDKAGSNRIFPGVPTNPESGYEFLDRASEKKRIGYSQRPLGPAGPGTLFKGTRSAIRANDLYESLLKSNPYQIKGLLAFGGNLSTSNPESLVAKMALQKLEFYVHVDLFMNPSTQFADILLPAATFWESAGIKPGFKHSMKANRHVQYREPVLPPQNESKPDLTIIFELAEKFGVGDKFWNGDIESALNYLIEPSGLTVDDLRKHPGGITLDLSVEDKNYCKVNPDTGAPKGFNTPSRKIEIFNQLFKDNGYDPIPIFNERIYPKTSEEYPLLLTFFKTAVYSHGMGRCIPSLRKAVPEPYIEVNPAQAARLNIEDKQWVKIETKNGSMRAKARFVDTILEDVVATQHGWWQECVELRLPGYEPFSPEGSNANMLTSGDKYDPINGSYHLKGIPCRLKIYGC